MALTHIIAYDISEDARRARAAAVLQAYGDRIQRSVFICTLEAEALHELCDRLSQIINPRTDSLHVFRQCNSCWEAITVYGQATVVDEPLYWAIL
jgi:CRISPR-associated protein Cas2